MNEKMQEWMNEWLNAWMNWWINERNEWINERMHEWIFKRITWKSTVVQWGCFLRHFQIRLERPIKRRTKSLFSDVTSLSSFQTFRWHFKAEFKKLFDWFSSCLSTGGGALHLLYKPFFPSDLNWFPIVLQMQPALDELQQAVNKAAQCLKLLSHCLRDATCIG